MTTKIKQAKMTWSPDEPVSIWGYTTEAAPGVTASYRISVYRTAHGKQYEAVVHRSGCKGIPSPVGSGIFKTQEEAKTACAVDALKYL